MTDQGKFEGFQISEEELETAHPPKPQPSLSHIPTNGHKVRYIPEQTPSYRTTDTSPLPEKIRSQTTDRITITAGLTPPPQTKAKTTSEVPVIHASQRLIRETPFDQERKSPSYKQVVDGVKILMENIKAGNFIFKDIKEIIDRFFRPLRLSYRTLHELGIEISEEEAHRLLISDNDVTNLVREKIINNDMDQMPRTQHLLTKSPTLVTGITVHDTMVCYEENFFVGTQLVKIIKYFFRIKDSKIVPIRISTYTRTNGRHGLTTSFIFTKQQDQKIQILS